MIRSEKHNTKMTGAMMSAIRNALRGFQKGKEQIIPCEAIRIPQAAISAEVALE